MPPIYASAPDDPTAEIEALRKEILAINLIQERSKSYLQKTAAHREAAAAAEKESARKEMLYAAGGPVDHDAPIGLSPTEQTELEHPLRRVSTMEPAAPAPHLKLKAHHSQLIEPHSLRTEESAAATHQHEGLAQRGMEDNADDCEADNDEAKISPVEDDAVINGNVEPPFVIKNLDTGEQVSLDALRASSASSVTPTLASRLTFGTVIPNSSEWDAAKAKCQGRLEKLAAKSSLSFRSYQLCVWQERYVFAEDNALCYRQLNEEHVPVGKVKRIPYASMQFVGPFDDLQFVIICPRRSYTFLTADSEETTRWIKALSALSGCSASTEVCRHTTLRRRWARDAGARTE